MHFGTGVNCSMYHHRERMTIYCHRVFIVFWYSCELFTIFSGQYGGGGNYVNKGTRVYEHLGERDSLCHISGMVYN